MAQEGQPADGLLDRASPAPLQGGPWKQEGGPEVRWMVTVCVDHDLNEAVCKHFLIHHLEKEMATHPRVLA